MTKLFLPALLALSSIALGSSATNPPKTNDQKLQSAPPPCEAVKEPQSPGLIQYTDGRTWNRWSMDLKTGYASGFIEIAPESYHPLGGTVGDAVKALDQFFDKPENASLPTAFAFWVYKARRMGTPESDIEVATSSVRALVYRKEHPEIK